MKQLITLLLLVAPIVVAAENFEVKKDTTIYHNGKKIIINDSKDDITVDIYQINSKGDTIQNDKIYEGVFIGGKSVETAYNNFTISIPEIFKSKEERKKINHRTHWSGFGLGFSSVAEGTSFDGELGDVMNVSRSLQYNLNITDCFLHFGNSNVKLLTGFGIQFNALHFQKNKAIEVVDYKAVLTTTDPDFEYKDTRLHFTYLTFPVLIETSFPLGKSSSHIFLNGGVVAKVKTASSSRVWIDDNGSKQKKKMPGDLNLRPFTLDLLVQAGINSWGVFASYSTMSLFIKDKGPKGNQASIGLQYYF